ncbi:MAG: tetratricopeptide repeat protein [Trichodesmium sp. MAG_R03]|nr:tetratricopeptide repeat protein [Trichodesmium sp. MAG_R03]
MYLQAIEIRKIALPENHPSIARGLNNQANLYNSQGKYDAAEPLLLQAIEILKQSLGEEHPNTQTVQKNYQIFFNKKNNTFNNKFKDILQRWIPSKFLDKIMLRNGIRKNNHS